MYVHYNNASPNICRHLFMYEGHSSSLNFTVLNQATLPLVNIYFLPNKLYGS